MIYLAILICSLLALWLGVALIAYCCILIGHVVRLNKVSAQELWEQLVMCIAWRLLLAVSRVRM